MKQPTNPGALPDPAQVTSLHLRRAVDGDQESLSWLIERLNPLLLAHAAWRLGPSLRRTVEPADLVHEAWLVMLPRLTSLPMRDGRLTPVLLSFLSTTVLHKVRNLLRREALRQLHNRTEAPSTLAPEFLAGPKSEVIAAVVRLESQSHVRTAIDELDADDRQIILLRGIEQQDPEDVAALLGLTRGTMSKRYRRALARMREQLPGSAFAELNDD